MLAELLQSLSNDVAMGLAQAAGAIVLCLAVVLLCRRFAVHVERETAISLVRGLVQMVLVGVVLALLLHGNLLVGALILLAMTFAAAVTASRRAQGMESALLLCFYAIVAGAGTVIAGMLATETLTTEIAVLVPVGSMIIANAMNACAQSLERFRADVGTHVGQVKAGLALGADPAATVAPYVQSAVYASLIPCLDMLKSLGLVWIPGVMAGMMVSGASPVYAGIYQFIVVAMILAASGITGLIVTLLVRGRAFTCRATGAPPTCPVPNGCQFELKHLQSFGSQLRGTVTCVVFVHTTCAVRDQHFIQLGYALVSSGVPLTQCFPRCWYACHHHCSS